MAKSTSLFICQQCGNEFSKWFGKCPSCGEWNSLVETVKITGSKKPSSGKSINKEVKKPVKLTSISTKKTPRIRTKIEELDRSLGGGLVSGQVVLLAGEPGIGKSTLLLQLANNLKNVLYVSGEESINQVSIRANRLKVNNKNILFQETTDVDVAVEDINSSKNLDLIIIDSIQTMATSDLSGLSGSVGQVRECTFRLLHMAKSKNIPLILVGHVTKDGSVAGPSTLAHMVDTVLWFEGDKSLTLRLLRAVKNRFGPTDEVGIFSMEEKGLVSMSDPEKMFLDKSNSGTPGSVTACLLEGTRSILVEIQSLVVPTKLAFPRRVGQGIDSKRLEMLLAVLTRRVGINFYDKDVFVNVAGGIKANDPSVDLAICLSLVSSHYNKPVLQKLIAIGEVGLLGEIRKVVQSDKRVKEAKRLGYTSVIDGTKYKTLKEVIQRLYR